MPHFARPKDNGPQQIDFVRVLCDFIDERDKLTVKDPAHHEQIQTARHTLRQNTVESHLAYRSIARIVLAMDRALTF